jgi:hypothetical protein
MRRCQGWAVEEMVVAGLYRVVVKTPIGTSEKELGFTVECEGGYEPQLQECVRSDMQRTIAAVAIACTLGFLLLLLL